MEGLGFVVGLKLSVGVVVEYNDFSIGIKFCKFGCEEIVREVDDGYMIVENLIKISMI